MYYINKIVGWCLSPLGIAFALMPLASIDFRAFKPFKLIKPFILFFAFVWLWVFSCGFLTRWIGLPLEGEEVDLAGLPSADAIVLLGGGMSYHEQCGRPEICSGADRVWAAAKLFKAGKAPLMTASGEGAPAEIALLSEMGVDTNRIVSLDAARNTEEEARFIAEAIRRSPKVQEGESQLKPKILLVTSAWHMPRAKMLFERVGFDVVAAPTDYEAHACAESPLGVIDFFPSAEALHRNSYLAKEWVALFCYRLKEVKRI